MLRTTSLSGISLLAVLCLVGCGSDSSAPQPVSQTQPSSSPTAPSSPTSMPSADSGGMSAGPSAMSDPSMSMDPASMMDAGAMDPSRMAAMPGAAGPAGAAGPVVPSRPEDFQDWTSQHITSALEERDPKVLRVLPIYAQQRRGDDAAAQEVVAWMGILMEPPKEPPKATANGAAGAYPGTSSAYPGMSADPAEMIAPETDPGLLATSDPAMSADPGTSASYSQGGAPKQNAPASPKPYAEALIDTLLSLQTLTSYQAARDLLEGLISLPLDEEQIARQTLTSLIQNIQGLHDPAVKILKQSLTQPVAILDSQGDFDSQKMQKVSSEEHWKNAMALVDGLMGVTSNEQPKKAQSGSSYDETMMATGPEMFGRGPSPTAERRNNERKAETLNPIPPNLRLKDFSQERAEIARNYVWSEEMVENLTAQLNATENLLSNPELFMLAGQIPATSSRFALKNFLEQNWTSNDEPSRNPVALVRHDVFKKYMRDPGLLISLKAIPREQNTASEVSETPSDFGSDGGQREAVNGRDSESVDKGMWYEASEQLMLSWLDKMHQASSQQSLPDFNPDELDIRMHRGAIATLSARLLLDRGVRSENPEEELFDRTTVNYVRIESPQMDERTVKHYRSAIKGEKVFSILNNNGMWMESSGRDRGTNELYSIDILLSRNNARKSLQPQQQTRNQPPSIETSDPAASIDPSAYGASSGGGGQAFVVEILTIRIPDPEVFLVPETEEPAKVSSRK